jgi:hypothetical protein
LRIAAKSRLTDAQIFINPLSFTSLLSSLQWRADTKPPCPHFKSFIQFHCEWVFLHGSIKLPLDHSPHLLFAITTLRPCPPRGKTAGPCLFSRWIHVGHCASSGPSEEEEKKICVVKLTIVITTLLPRGRACFHAGFTSGITPRPDPAKKRRESLPHRSKLSLAR